MTPPKVFISYSHDSKSYINQVLTLANRLRREGIDCIVDQYEESPLEGWPRWTENQLKWAEFVLISCTQQYFRRFSGKEEYGRGRGVSWEGAIITQELYGDQTRNSKFIPILFSVLDEEFIPTILRSSTYYNVFDERGYENLYRRLTNQPSVEKLSVGAVVQMPPREISFPAQAARVQKQQFQPIRPTFFVYDDAWVGRENTIEHLNEIIQNNRRLLMLVGISGIGKTALGERLSVEVSDWFDNDWNKYQQENFDNEEQLHDFCSVGTRWLEKWGNLVTQDDRQNPQRILERLIKYLMENRRLLQMDSLENLLQWNEEKRMNEFKDEWWVKFFSRFLKEDACPSCIILTSQDLPEQLQIVATRSPNFFYCQPLYGLEKPEQIALFEKIGLDIALQSGSYLERIGAAYEGHPLAIRIIAGEMMNHPFNGNVIAYWGKYGCEVEEVEKAIAEAELGNSSGEDKWKIDRFTQTLKRNVLSRLNKTFTRLKEDVKYAYILLCEASVYRCPVPEEFWLSHLDYWNKDETEQRAALDTLRSRYLVEEVIDDNRYLLRQHNLVRSCSLEHLRQLHKTYEHESTSST